MGRNTIFCGYASQVNTPINIIIPITAKRGTGWIIASGYAVTNYHVVEDCQNVSLIISDGTAIPLKIEIFDKINDIAILSIAENKNKFFQPIPMSEKSSGIGARVFTIGYPYSSAFGVKPKLTDGVISSIYGIQDDPRFYQISVPIQPGNSGGPLVNLRGQAIGMVTSTLDAAKVFNISGTLPQNINYAIKSEYIQILLKTIKKEYQVSTQKEDYKNLEELARKVQDSVFIIDAK